MSLRRSHAHHLRPSAPHPQLRAPARLALALSLPMALLGALIALTAAPASAALLRPYQTQLTGTPTGNSRSTVPFVGPWGLAVDGSDDLWVSEEAASRQGIVDEFNSSGELLRQAADSTEKVGLFNGKNGRGETIDFSDASGHLYIYDREAGGLWVLESDGSPVPAPGGFIGHFSACCDVYTAADNSAGPTGGDIYAADSEFGFVERLDGAGNPAPFTASEPYIPKNEDGEDENRITGTPAGGFAGPASGLESESYGHLAVAPNGDLYDVTGGLVYVFASSGEFLREFAGPLGEPFASASAIAIDPTNGNVLIAEPTNHVVDEFTSTGEFLEQINGEETPARSLGEPRGLAVDSSGKLYVSDRANDVVDVFDSLTSLPGATTGATSELTAKSVTLSGDLAPAQAGEEVTACRFEYVTELEFEAHGYSSAPSKECSPASPYSSPTEVSAEISSLIASTAYRYRLVVSGPAGTDRGHGRTFTTPVAVEGLTTGEATEIEQGSATLNGSYAGDGTDTHYYFEYVSQEGFEKEGFKTALVTPTEDNGSGEEETEAVSAAIAELQGGTTYHYRVVATNPAGTNVGEGQTFETLPAITDLETLPATEVTNVSAELHGSYTAEAGIATEYFFEYGTTTEYGFKGRESTVPGTPTGTQEVSATIGAGSEEKLEPGTTYHYRVVAENKYGPTAASNDETFTTAQPPTIEAFSSSEVTATSAVLHARINPQGFPTTYRFEYGPTTAYGQTAPQPEGEITAGLSESHTIGVPIEGLQRGVTYHFRLRAENKWDPGQPVTSEDQSFEFFPPSCPNTAVRQQTGSAYLPDCRAYELVSPPNANATLLYSGGPTSGQATSPSRFAYTGAFGAPPEATNTIDSDGDLYVATRTDTGWVSKYIGLPGNQAACMGGSPDNPWSHSHHAEKLQDPVFTDPGMSRFLDFIDGTGIGCYSGGNGTGDAGWELNPPSNAPYLWSSEGDLLAHLPTDLDSTPGAAAALLCPVSATQNVFPECASEVTASGDLTHLVFSSNKLAFAEGGLTEAPGSAYDDDLATGHLTLISRLENGQPIPQDPAFALIPAQKEGTETQVPGGEEEFIRFPAVSTDGSHILMSTATAPTPYCDESNAVHACPHFTETPVRLYMSVDDAAARQISVNQVSGENVPVDYVGMTSDGAKVFFTSEEHLTGEDLQHGGASLYMWSEKGEEEGHPLTLISKAAPGSPAGAGDTPECHAALATSYGVHGESLGEAPWTSRCGVVAYSGWFYATAPGGRGGNGTSDTAIASENGDIYFYSPEQLDGTRGVPNQQNLYDYREGRVQYVTTLAPGPHCEEGLGNASVCTDGPIARLQVTPDDAHMALVTADRLTSYENAGHLEMYSYTPATGAFVCDSCNPDGEPATADVYASQNGLFLTEDGRTFFSTTESLVPRDTNEGEDVYEFVDGRAQLITPGTGTATVTGGDFIAAEEQPGLVGVSANGTDVYFSTYDSLVSEDQNGNFLKFYDARTDGGFPQPPPTQPCEAAEECHGPGTEAPQLPAAGAEATLAGGNATPEKKQAAKHKKAKARHRVRKSHRKHRVRKSHRKRAGNRRAAR